MPVSYINKDCFEFTDNIKVNRKTRGYSAYIYMSTQRRFNAWKTNTQYIYAKIFLESYVSYYILQYGKFKHNHVNNF